MCSLCLFLFFFFGIENDSEVEVPSIILGSMGWMRIDWIEQEENLSFYPGYPDIWFSANFTVVQS